MEGRMRDWNKNSRSPYKAKKELRAHEFVTGNPSKGGDLEGRMRDWNKSAEARTKPRRNYGHMNL